MPLCANCNTFQLSADIRRQEGQCHFCNRQVCRACGCTENFACVFSQAGQQFTCGWHAPGLCDNPECLIKAREIFPLAGALETRDPRGFIERESVNVLYEGQPLIIYAGFNNSGERLVGAQLIACDVVQATRTIHVVTTEPAFTDFSRTRISYRELVRAAEAAFVIDVPFNRSYELVYQVAPETLGDDLLPDETMYRLIQS
jgi:hypothetical protein